MREKPVDVNYNIAYRLTALLALLFIVGIVTQLTLIQIQAHENSQLIIRNCSRK